MDESPIPVDARDQSRAWADFPKSPIQAVLHNELLRLLKAERESFVRVEKWEKIEVIKGRIEVLKKVLGVLHRHDPLATRYKRDR